MKKPERFFISWIPILEKHNIKYKVNIPEEKIMNILDVKAYGRILDNLIKNAIIHSKCTEITVNLTEERQEHKLQ